MTEKKILIYCDEGVGETSERETFRSLNEIFGESRYAIEKVNHQFVNQAAWADKTALFVMPGGRSSPHYKLLADGGNEKLINYVKKGGKYLGICAGGYYGCAYTEFAKGHPKLEICHPGVLNFFPGMAKGPMLGVEKFEYKKLKFNLVKILSAGNQKVYHVLYYGGSCFMNAVQYDSVQILASYDDVPEKPAAIIQCQYGKGMAILMGVHIEFNHSSLTSEELDESTNQDQLRASERERKEIFEKIIWRFQL